MRIVIIVGVWIAGILSLALPAQAQILTDQTTNFTITVRAHDSQFIGNAMGGTRIMVRDRRSGDILAEGVAYGDEGGTTALTTDPLKRDAVLAGPETAKMQFSLELVEPTPVTISATGPQSQPQSLATVSMDTVLVPGKDYSSGNGIMLDMPGFAVDVLTPAANAKEKYDAQKSIMTITANVLKMDGSPVAKDSRWPPERVQVDADLYLNGRLVDSEPLKYSGTPGLYAQRIKAPMAGIYRIVVTAFDTQTKEAGTDSTTITFAK
jgi:hypothetical protein